MTENIVCHPRTVGGVVSMLREDLVPSIKRIPVYTGMTALHCKDSAYAGMTESIVCHPRGGGQGLPVQRVPIVGASRGSASVYQGDSRLHGNDSTVLQRFLPAQE